MNISLWDINKNAGQKKNLKPGHWIGLRPYLTFLFNVKNLLPHTPLPLYFWLSLPFWVFVRIRQGPCRVLIHGHSSPSSPTPPQASGRFRKGQGQILARNQTVFQIDRNLTFYQETSLILPWVPKMIAQVTEENFPNNFSSS